MTDPTERADRARRMSQVIEAHTALDIAVALLQRAVPQLEQALGVQHDAAKAAHELLDRGRAALAKTNIARQRLPWP